MKVRLSDDSFARALGSREFARALQAAEVDVEYTGSYGMAWAEPLMEFELNGALHTVKNASTTLISEALNGFQRGRERSSLSSYLGSIKDEPYFRNQTRLVFDRAGIKPQLKLPDFSQLDRLLALDPEEIIDALEVAGLRGRGGAGFPAHIKWRTVRDTPSDQKFVTCNADEGDSGTFSDRMIMEADPFRLIEGMIVAGHATGATSGIIYLRSEYPVAREYLERAIAIAYENKLLGRNIRDSDTRFDIELFIGAGAYICGEETSMLESLEGKRGQIRFKPPVPAISGLLGKPTLVHNVITLASVPGIFAIGSEEYAALGVGASTGTMPFQLSGNVKRGGLIEVPFGISIRELIYEYGQGTLSDRPFRTVQIGGPLGAYLSERELDTPLTFEALAEIGAGIGHGGLVVFDDSVDMREQAEYAFEFCELESCGKCTPCRIGSVRGKEAMQAISHSADENRLQVIEDLCEVMEQASLCLMGGMTPIPVRSAMQRFPEDFRKGTT